VEGVRPDSAVDELRLATPDDVPAIIDLYRGLSPESQLMRFSTHVSEDVLLRAAFLDERFDAVIALRDGRVVGEARLETDPDSDHEFAITVADHAQGRGVGTALLDGLRERAGDRGIVTLRAQVRSDNVPMLTLLRRIGGVIVLVSGGDVVIDIASDRQMPGWSSRGTGMKILIEAAGLMERPITTALRAAGYDVRQCGGPGSGRREPCPLLFGGRCRLADEADNIVFLLPESDVQSRAVLAAHVSDRSDRLGVNLTPSIR
jgi:[ribosomal protein S18]-alanine N-acetyltransferase